MTPVGIAVAPLVVNVAPAGIAIDQPGSRWPVVGPLGVPCWAQKGVMRRHGDCLKRQKPPFPSRMMCVLAVQDTTG